MSVLVPTVETSDAGGARAGRLTRLHQWVVTVDHKRLGVMYVLAGLAFFLVAGIEAGVMRWQLAVGANPVAILHPSTSSWSRGS
jgi:cytochrome c oxidase subunit I